MKNFLIFCVCLLVMACGSEEEEVEIRTINLTVNKTTALSSGDSIVMVAEVLDRLFSPVEGLPVVYLVDDRTLPSNVFYPTEIGVFRLSARYQDVSSSGIDIEVIDAADQIDELILIHHGPNYLTTNPWSVSGKFTFRLVKDNQTFDVDNSSIPLFLNDGQIQSYEGLFFDEPGIYKLYARQSGVKSNEINIEVRVDEVPDLVEIPIIFHSYGFDPGSNEILNLLNHLNGAYVAEDYSTQEVKEGIAGPNAVNMNLKFKLADLNPDGLTMPVAGLNIVDAIDDQNLVPSTQEFKMLRNDYNWNPEVYINIWLLSDFGFDPIPSGMIQQARGIYSAPVLFDAGLDGLLRSDVDSSNFNDCIVMNSLVAFAHPDFIIGIIGHYMGLFTTLEFACVKEGDHCGDTPTLDLSLGKGPNDEFSACEGYFFHPTNYMSINQNYSHFTLDQRNRVRTVLAQGLNRPGGI